jgi:dipeptidase E
MKRLILFSQPSLEIFEKLKSTLFPDFIKDKVFAYMPSEGDNYEVNNKFTPVWQEYAESNGANYLYIDNSKRGNGVLAETEKMKSANIMMITGGNTFKLLNHLKLSGLDGAILRFWNNDNVVLAGFSAGAIVLTPTIETAKYGDPNEVDLTDLTGLNIVKFEVWPHYEQGQKKELNEFRSRTENEIRTIGNDDVLIIDEV